MIFPWPGHPVESLNRTCRTTTFFRPTFLQRSGARCYDCILPVHGSKVYHVRSRPVPWTFGHSGNSAEVHFSKVGKKTKITKPRMLVNILPQNRFHEHRSNGDLEIALLRGACIILSRAYEDAGCSCFGLLLDTTFMWKWYSRISRRSSIIMNEYQTVVPPWERQPSILL